MPRYLTFHIVGLATFVFVNIYTSLQGHHCLEAIHSLPLLLLKLDHSLRSSIATGLPGKIWTQSSFLPSLRVLWLLNRRWYGYVGVLPGDSYTVRFTVNSRCKVYIRFSAVVCSKYSVQLSMIPSQPSAKGWLCRRTGSRHERPSSIFCCRDHFRLAVNRILVLKST